MKIRQYMAAFLLTGLAVFGGVSASAASEKTISQGVHIDDIDVSGMTYEEADAAVKQRVEELRSSKITVQVGEDSIQATASELGLQWDNKDVVSEAMDIGNAGNLIKRYKDSKDLANADETVDLKFSANANAIKNYIEEDCKQFEREATEATIESDGGGGINLTPGTAGQVINVDESVKTVQDYIANEWTGDGGTVTLSVEVDEPEGTEEDLETITDCLGTYTTYYGSTEGRNLNVERGAELINGHIVYPGDTFSVCDHLVPFTAENGYEKAGAYENGRVVQEYGGGICQVSTTLYNALLLAELDIVERHNHTMSVTYVDPSMDAAIAEGSMDLIFRNNYDTPIFISGYASGGVLTFSVWGKETRPEDREMWYESVVTGETTEDGVALYAADDQNVGYIQQVQSAMGGMTAELWKYVSYNGETTSEQVNSSVYEATPTSYEVGTIGASDALLQAIANNDLAAAQAAMTGGTVTTTTDVTGLTTTDGTGLTTTTDTTGIQIETNATDTITTETPATDTTSTDASTGYVDPTTGYVDTTGTTGYTDGTTSGYTDGTVDTTGGYTDGTVDTSGTYTDTTTDAGVVTW